MPDSTDVPAAGSAVMQTQFPGSEHEMVTLFHLDGDDVMMTHYCAAGNQPRMRPVAEDPAAGLHFKFAGGTNMRTADLHMHDVVLKLVDNNHLREVWTSYEDGRPNHAAHFELVRQK